MFSSKERQASEGEQTLVSVIKRKWREALSARLEVMQKTEAPLRGLVYNIYRLAPLSETARARCS